MRVPLATWWRRVSATVIDNLVLLIPTFVLSAYVTNTTISLMLSSLIGGGYQILLITSARGQTVGNMLSGTRVVRADDGHPVQVTAALLRWAFVGIPMLLVVALVGSKFLDVQSYLKAASTNGTAPPLSKWPTTVRGEYYDAVAGFGLLFVYLAADYLSPLWTQRKQTLHDMVARTVVLVAQ